VNGLLECLIPGVIHVVSSSGGYIGKPGEASVGEAEIPHQSETAEAASPRRV
jgi:hypothetical protein